VNWYVWNVEQGLPARPVFLGTMEDCYWVADALNARTPTDGIGFTVQPSEDAESVNKENQ